jgi:NAD(P)-dependent dehydrogenase (short-subunit alcohol dehydrogenase family)
VSTFAAASKYRQEQDDEIEVLRRSALGEEDGDLTKFDAVPLRIDISSEQEIKSAVEGIMAEADAVDVLVNNAGFGLYGAVEDISVDEAGYQFGMKVSDPVRLTQLVLPAMLVKGVGA